MRMDSGIDCRGLEFSDIVFEIFREFPKVNYLLGYF